MEKNKKTQYKVSIYEKTCIGTYPLTRAEIIDNKNEACGYIIYEEEKGNKVKIEEINVLYITKSK